MPHLYLGGSFSVEQLALYQVLRRVIIGLYGFEVDIDHFYQPADAVTHRALDWLETAPRTRPRFAMIHYMDPHDPYMLHDGSGVGYTSALIGANPDPAQWRDTLEAAYHREVAYLDEHLGPVLAALNDAIVVFTGDHGEEFYEHGGWFHGPTVYEEVLRVPLIVRFPGGEGGGRVSTALARHVDFMPTVLRWAGLEASPELPGVPLFDDAANLTETGPHSYAETDFLGNIGYGLRSEDHKLIEANPGNPSGMPVTGFYEMAPGSVEGANIAGSGDAEESRMTSALHAIRRALGEL
jgi:arylsulfatase A-like enzyme